MQNFLNTNNTLFPCEAVECIIKAEKSLRDANQHTRLTALCQPLINEEKPIGELLAEMDEIAARTNLFPYTVYLLAYLHCAEAIREMYKKFENAEQLFDGFLQNIVSCMQECFSLHNVWGVLHGTWHQGFLIQKRYALDNFVFDVWEYPYETYTKAGISVRKGDPVYNIHIPTGASLKREDRIRAYQSAYSFFAKKVTGNYMCFACNSWLLYPENKKFFPAGSKILDFIQDFDVICRTDHDTFHDAWRVFGAAHTEKRENWPQETALQKAYIKWLSQGGKTGDGFGVMLFDGEKIIK